MDLPEEQYRRQLFDAVMASKPQSLLDVGCGDGTFLVKAAERGCRGTGLEPDGAGLEGLAKRGVDVRMGRAEALPLPRQQF